MPAAIFKPQVHELGVSAGVKQIALAQNAVDKEAVLYH